MQPNAGKPANCRPALTNAGYEPHPSCGDCLLTDPDAQFYENYVCGALRNYTGYCNKSVDALVVRQSRESDVNKRRQLVWQIERKLREENARPDIWYVRGVNCRQPRVNGLVSMVNSIYNGSRFEDVRLDK